MSDRPSATGKDAAGPSPMDTVLGYQLRRASAAILSRLAAALQGLDLKIAEASILMVLLGKPRLTQSELGRILGIQRANMNPLVSSLDARGLLVRTQADGRSHGLILSEEGLALAKEAKRRSDAFEAGLIPDLTPAERAWMIDVLSRIWSE